MKNGVTPALTYTNYFEAYLRHLRSKGVLISLVGFSAGSMLAIKMSLLGLEQEVNGKKAPLIVNFFRSSVFDQLLCILTF